jgi:hypothetical protein
LLVVLLVGVVALVAHSAILYYAWSHTSLWAAVLSGTIVVIVIKHLGLLGSLYAVFRRRSRHSS